MSSPRKFQSHQRGFLLNPYRFNAEPVPTDPFYSNVVLLLKGEGTNGSTNIVDSSPFPKTASVMGNTQITTSQVKYGTGSIAFDGAGDYLRYDLNPAFAMAVGQDFALEAWVRMSDFPLDDYVNIFFLVNSGGTGAVTLRFGNAGFGRKLQVSMNSQSAINVYSCAVTQFGFTGTGWRHIAFTRTSSVCRLFVDGVAQYLGQGIDPSTYPVTSFVDSTGYSSLSCNIGDGISGGGLIGYIDEARITIGNSRYSADFTPPLEEFPSS